MRILFALLILVGTARAESGPVIALRMDETAVRPRCYGGVCKKETVLLATGRGSGVVVQRSNNQLIVLTNRHNAERHPNTADDATISLFGFIGGAWRPGQFTKISQVKEIDLAIAVFPDVPGQPIAAISRTAPTEGEAVYLHSFLGGLQERRQPASLFYNAPRTNGPKTSKPGSVHLTQNTVGGQSGGGVFNQQGHLVGVIWGAEQNQKAPAGIGFGLYWGSPIVTEDRSPLYGLAVAYEPMRQFATQYGGAQLAPEGNENWQPQTPPVNQPDKPANDGMLIDLQARVDAQQAILESIRDKQQEFSEAILKSETTITEKHNESTNRFEQIIQTIETIRNGAQATTEKPKGGGFFDLLTTIGIPLLAGTGGAGIAIPLALWFVKRRLRKHGEVQPQSVDLAPQVGVGSPAPQVPQVDSRIDQVIGNLNAMIGRFRQLESKVETISNRPPQVEVQTVPVPIHTDTPPQVRVETEQKYYPIESAEYREAMQYAQKELVQKFPDALGSVDFLNSVVDQYLTGKRHKNQAKG